ncbi:hypothetical protein GCM10022225_15600 [Plantactinospora mayteni]|uniref:Uncharacterized protein n=1 Tax=Plantactinospora mayteni TaxID=566021 RepID=A0ABQ4EG51_9ACTN|nr:hypothetical protein Pma05_02070 [Plantactinospora mayteni]
MAGRLTDVPDAVAGGGVNAFPSDGGRRPREPAPRQPYPVASVALTSTKLPAGPVEPVAIVDDVGLVLPYPVHKIVDGAAERPFGAPGSVVGMSYRLP